MLKSCFVIYSLLNVEINKVLANIYLQQGNILAVLAISTYLCQKSPAMEILKIEILNPKAKVILNGLVELKLISIKKERKKSEMKSLLAKLRQYPETPTSQEVVNEVEAVRKARYAKK